MTDRADCKEKIGEVFDYFDLNKDGFVTRCEDATFQRAMGESKEFALRFSAPFTRDSFNKICEKKFAY